MAITAQHYNHLSETNIHVCRELYQYFYLLSLQSISSEKTSVVVLHIFNYVQKSTLDNL